MTTMLASVLALMMTMNIESARAAIVLKENPVAVVMPYLDKSTKSAELTLRDVTWVSEYLIEELIDTEKFIIPPRERMHEILNEHKINQSGLVDTSTGVSIGNWIGAQYMIVGSVTGLSAKESGIDIGVNVDKGSSSDTSASTSKQGVNLDGSKYTVIANITLRVTSSIILVRTASTFRLKKLPQMTPAILLHLKQLRLKKILPITPAILPRLKKILPTTPAILLHLKLPRLKKILLTTPVIIRQLTFL